MEKIKLFAFARFQAILATLLGFLAGFLFSFGGLIIDALVSLGWVITQETPGLAFGTVLAFAALIGMPVIFAMFGFVAGLIEALLSNLSGTWFGGISFDFVEKKS